MQHTRKHTCGVGTNKHGSFPAACFNHTSHILIITIYTVTLRHIYKADALFVKLYKHEKEEDAFVKVIIAPQEEIRVNPVTLNHKHPKIMWTQHHYKHATSQRAKLEPCLLEANNNSDDDVQQDTRGHAAEQE